MIKQINKVNKVDEQEWFLMFNLAEGNCTKGQTEIFSNLQLYKQPH